MNKYTIIVILLILIILGLGLGLWLSSKNNPAPIDKNQNSVIDEQNKNQNQEEPNNSFTTEKDCHFVCGLIGYQQGTCLAEAKAKPDIKEISACLIKDSADCGQEGQCSCYCWDKQEKEGKKDNETGLPNPAAVYCQKQGGTIDLRDEETGVAGYCLFENGSECEEWAYFNGECQPQDNPNE